ncbi:hypothetical protein [Pseudophaeobacter flagellatus]|uniref:hypothetical protein n=1 Tax=Pseudophaeobacter flagellatus TaxID=2899119 RepID=UPI001E45AB80|nr:hypothetical protein [Pseudophaeobacter flagellatus]MCD9147867.1 hypothetical protein [Pseudophaeobacter flagellatus]
MKALTNSRFSTSLAPLPERFHGQIADAAELALALEVGARPDTATISIENRDTGELAAYAVIGPDDDGMVVIYVARSWLTGLGAMAIRGLFGAAQCISSPLRVHADQIRTYARILGAENALSAIDADGVPMGVFHG